MLNLFLQETESVNEAVCRFRDLEMGKEYEILNLKGDRVHFQHSLHDKRFHR